MPTAISARMSLVDSVKALHAARREEIVVTTMGAAREWQKLGKHPLDFVLVPSSMGQATSLGLGMALARPDRKVVVCNGDGSMLMNLGSLVTITAQAPANLTVILFDNGVYEVTGVQPTLAAATLRRDAAAARFCRSRAGLRVPPHLGLQRRQRVETARPRNHRRKGPGVRALAGGTCPRCRDDRFSRPFTRAGTRLPRPPYAGGIT